MVPAELVVRHRDQVEQPGLATGRHTKPCGLYVGDMYTETVHSRLLSSSWLSLGRSVSIPLSVGAKLFWLPHWYQMAPTLHMSEFFRNPGAG